MMWPKPIVAAFFLLSVTLVGAQSAALGLPDDIAEYFGWERANAQKSLEASAHPIAKDIYLNGSAAESVGSGSFPHAEGSIFVKESVDPEQLSVTVVSAMRKVADFNPDGGDWQYGMFERQDDGSFTGDWMSVAEAAMCAECHSSAAESDYTFLSYLTE
jgi:hypothetical protein